MLTFIDYNAYWSVTLSASEQIEVDFFLQTIFARLKAITNVDFAITPNTTKTYQITKDVVFIENWQQGIIVSLDGQITSDFKVIKSREGNCIRALDFSCSSLDVAFCKEIVVTGTFGYQNFVPHTIRNWILYYAKTFLELAKNPTALTTMTSEKSLTLDRKRSVNQTQENRNVTLYSGNFTKDMLSTLQYYIFVDQYCVKNKEHKTC